MSIRRCRFRGLSNWFNCLALKSPGALLECALSGAGCVPNRFAACFVAAIFLGRIPIVGAIPRQIAMRRGIGDQNFRFLDVVGELMA